MRSAEVLEALDPVGDVDLGQVDRSELEIMAEAGAVVVNVHRVLSKTQDNVVGELLKGEETFYEWNHYPKGDVYDHETHGQFYYHAHAQQDRFEGEHGHFHTFVRQKGMPPGIKPEEGPDAVLPKDPNDALSHIIAIAMDKHGIPFRLFTVNRWVTGETWYSADDVITLLDYFKIDHTRPSWPVNCWVTAMVRLFKPQIIELVRQRDHTIEQWRQHKPGVDIFEDRSIEVTSYLDISIDGQIEAINQALG